MRHEEQKETQQKILNCFIIFARRRGMPVNKAIKIGEKIAQQYTQMLYNEYSGCRFSEQYAHRQRAFKEFNRQMNVV